MAAESAVTYARDKGVARITLNRPHALNAENVALVEGLERAVELAAQDPDVAVVVVQGAGHAFCAGMDLAMLSAEGMPAGFYATQERAFARLETADKITLAALHGYCIGGGLQLAIACDLRACSSDARLGVPALEEGLFPGMAVHRLPRLIGLGPARRLILSGELVDAQEALRLGLVDYLLPAERFEQELEQLVERCRRAPRHAAIASKRLLAGAFSRSFEETYEASLPLLADCLASPELAAAMEAWRRRAGAEAG